MCTAVNTEFSFFHCCYFSKLGPVCVFFVVVAKHFNVNTKCKASSSQEMWQKTHVKDSKENLGGFFFFFLYSQKFYYKQITWFNKNALFHTIF